MISPGRYDLSADRWVACIRTFSFVGLDLTGANFAAQVRLEHNAPGFAFIDLSTVTTASEEGVRVIDVQTQTIAEHIADGLLDKVPPGYAAGDVVVVSQIGLRINEVTMETTPWGPEREDDAVFVWDLLITPSGGIKDKYLGGDFIVRGGATQ